MLTIDNALQRIKGNLERWVPEDLVRRLAQRFRPEHRERLLPPVVTTYLFLKQVLHGNVACAHVCRLSGLDVSDGAYCRARSRLPYGFFHALQSEVTGRCLRLDPRRAEDLWHGHEVVLIDGSSFSMPDTPELQAEFGQPGGQRAGCGFPTAHLLLICHASGGFIRKVLAAPRRTHDLSQAALLHKEIPANAVLVGDRAFCSYAHLVLCHGRGLHAVFRAHQKSLIDFRPGRPYASPDLSTQAARGLPRSRFVRRLGKHDHVVEYFKPKECPNWMTPKQYAALPAALLVRELRYTIRLPGRRSREVTLVTTLLNRRRYSRRALALLYGLRWRVETQLRHLKTTLKMDVLRCQTFVGVMKELMVFVTVYNLVSRVRREAGRRQGVPAERISFADAMRWLASAGPGEDMPLLKVVQERPGRVEPRVRKRRPKQYPLLRKPRHQLRQALLDDQEAA